MGWLKLRRLGADRRWWEELFLESTPPVAKPAWSPAAAPVTGDGTLRDFVATNGVFPRPSTACVSSDSLGGQPIPGLHPANQLQPGALLVRGSTPRASSISLSPRH